VCDWFVTVKLRGTLVACVTCKNRQKSKWKTQDKRNSITTIIIKIKITIIKRMKIVDTDNKGKKITIIFVCINTISINSRNKKHVILVCFDAFSRSLYVCNFDINQTVTHVSCFWLVFKAAKHVVSNLLPKTCLIQVTSKASVSS